MCIAIIKPSGFNIPSKEELLTCWNNNPHGAGFTWNDGNKVNIQKGFLKFKQFYKALMEIDKKHDLKKHDVVLHFRIATHGGINRECTHPFIVCNDIERMKKLQSTCDYAIAHNGIIYGYGGDKVSDTMDFTSKIISKIKHIEDQEALLDALAKEHFSRLVILFKNGYIKGGDWIEAKNGLYYSNSSYKEVPTIKKTYTVKKPYTSYLYSSTYKSDEIYDYCDNCGQLKKLNTGGDFWLCDKCLKEYIDVLKEEGAA